MRARKAVVAGSLIATVVVLTGCATAPRAGSPDGVAGPVDAIQCVDGFSPEVSAQPPPVGEVPEGFGAIAAYRCDTSASETDDTGTWAGVRITRLEGDLDRLLRALSEPDDPPAAACPAVGYVVPDLWLADAQGRYVRVGYPAAGCGPKTESVDAALSVLTEVESRFERSELVESTAATASGCATQAGVIVLAELDDVVEDSEVGAPVESEDANLIPFEPTSLPGTTDVDGMLVCAYAVEPGGVGGDGWYFDSWSLDRDQAAAVLHAVETGGGVNEGCAAAATHFVSAQPLVDGAPTAALTVELDGCRRVIDLGFRPSSASDALLTLLAHP